MRKLLLLSIGLLLLATAGTTLADGPIRLSLRMDFPAVLPPLVEVEPGVRVVRDFDEEVFFTKGYYWAQRDGNWYRARDHRGTWRYVQPARLPADLSRQEPGHYRRWQHDDRRSWPDAHHARRDARHWRANDYRELRQPQEERPGEHRRMMGDERHGDHMNGAERERP